MGANVHYDNMINVEGSVDKSFSKEFQKNSKDVYKDVINQLVSDLRRYGVLPARNHVLADPINFR